MQVRMLVALFSVLFVTSFCFSQTVSAAGSAQIRERLVVNALQTIMSAQATYQATSSTGIYGSLEQLRHQNYIDAALATGTKYSYYFTVTVGSGGFKVSAVPQRYRKSGIRSFFLDESGVIRGADRNGGPATTEDLPVPVNCGEIGAVSVMRIFSGAQSTYLATIGEGSYGNLSQLLDAGLVGASLSAGVNCGYIFSVVVVAPTANSPAGFRVKSIPEQYGISGSRSFYVDETGVVRGADRGGAEATADDPPI